jgi:hypothetical protein
MAVNGAERVLVSHLTLRRLVGVLGIGLPVVLALCGFVVCRCHDLQPSISDYYGLRTRDVLVGFLFAIAWMLFAYRGYDWRDDVAGNVAGVFALGVAIFPNSGTDWEIGLHFGSALGLFLVLAIFCLFLFTQSKGVRTPQKTIRNRIYTACGVVILVSIGLIGLYHWRLEDTPIAALKPVFWLESLALWVFGLSWFVKGETLFRDAPAESPRAR